MAAESGRKFVKYTFYKADLSWRQLPQGDRERSKMELVAVVEGFGSRMSINSYSLMGGHSGREETTRCRPTVMARQSGWGAHRCWHWGQVRSTTTCSVTCTRTRGMVIT